MTEEAKVETVTTEEFDALKATNERILNEHKADKGKWSKRFEAYEKAEVEKLAEAKDYKSLFEQSSSKIKTLESSLDNVKFDNFEKNLTLEIGRLAKDAHNPLQVMRALKINEGNTDLDRGVLSDLSTQLDALRKEESNLFKVDSVNQTTTVPRYMKSTSTNDKPISEMTVKELEQLTRSRVAARMST